MGRSGLPPAIKEPARASFSKPSIISESILGIKVVVGRETFGQGVGGSGGGGEIRLKGAPVAGWGGVPRGRKLRGGLLWELQVNSEAATFASYNHFFFFFFSLVIKRSVPVNGAG